MSARALAGVLAAASGWLGHAAEDGAWHAAVQRTITQTCAARGLTLNAPLQVRPMTEFQGGYTAGIGSVTWEADHARIWRQGWCALGVYCAAEPGDKADAAPASPYVGPAGLYDVDRHVLFVKNVQSAAATGTVAHETVHALQYQNFPGLNAVHLWHNRDLAAGANAVVEGDAHVVGWSFDPERRKLLCSMDPAHADTNHVQWWRWRPDALSALEGFPHVFGTEPALREMLAHGRTAMNRKLREPPLSTLAILRPETASAVDFIKLPQQIGPPECTVGLRNSAGVVGIWGLLRQHGDADAVAETLPDWLADWRGDRFAHVACGGQNDDELAWVTRWRSLAAAQEFARRYRAVAASIPAYGGVLGSRPEPTLHGQSVVVATAGIGDVVDAIADAETRAFSSFSDWTTSGCFPLDTCYGRGDVDAPSLGADPESPDANGVLCSRGDDKPQPLAAWLDRIRAVRANGDQVPAGFAGVSADAGRLAAFCAVNSARNSDLLTACRAVVGGSQYMATLHGSSRWRLLPYCAPGSEMRDWLVANYYADLRRPFASVANFGGIYGAGVAAQALADAGESGLRALIAAPPMSTLDLLHPAPSRRLEVIGLPRPEIAAMGCEVAASDVRGVLAIWTLFMDFDQAPEEDVPPSFLLDWRGDRLFRLRCASHAEGAEDEAEWVWVSRWQTTESAAEFAARYRRLAPVAAAETDLPVVAPVIDGRTVWIVPAAVARLETVLKDGVDVRAFDDFNSWVDAGCFPQTACN